MRPHRLPQCLLSALTLSLALAGPVIAAPGPEPVDILIRNGTVVDGSGGAPFVADVGIRNERIVLVQPSAASVQAKTVLDARGLVVAPGFIDPHTHAYHNLVSKDRHQNLPYLLQGVTTVVIGNDGIVLEADGPDLDRIGPTLKALEANRIGTNVAMLVGHNAVRHRVMGDVDRAPTADELKAMQSLMEDGMRDGAFGMSTGLVYTPGVFAKTDEVVALAKTVAARGGIYDTHLRDEGNFRTGLVNAVKEALDIGRQSGIPIHISHIKALGVDSWGKSAEVVGLMREAQASGMNVSASQYPYTASSTHIIPALVPGWARDGGNVALLKRLEDPATRARIAADMEKAMQQRNGPAAQVLISTNPEYNGQSLEALGKKLGVSPVDAAISVIQHGGTNIVSFNMSDADLEAFMKQDFVVGGSDGIAGHPREAGTFARRIGEYVTRKHVMTLPFAVRQASARTAEIFGIKDRGTVEAGKFADLVIFDPATYADRASYEQPGLPPVGVRWVLVNGTVAVADGKAVPDVLAGRALRKPAVQITSPSSRTSVPVQHASISAGSSLTDR